MRLRYILYETHMATIQSSDISFLLSGGSSNQNPALSLGGSPSSMPVSGNLNSLFADVESTEATSGLTDYRCFYILNGSATETLYSASIHVQSQSLGGSYADIGLSKSTEVQTLEISGSPTSGTLSMRLGGAEFQGTWGGSGLDFLTSLKSSMAAAGLGDIQVSYTLGSSHVFTLYFRGSLDNKAHPLVEVVSNGLSPASTAAVSRQTQGSPINSVAPLVATPSTSPSGVTFSQTSSSSKILVGSLGPGDSMPVWIRRTTPAGTDFKESDSITIRLSGDPFGLPTQASSSSSDPCTEYSYYQNLCPAEEYQSKGIPLSAFCRPVINSYPNGCPQEYGCGAYIGGVCVRIEDIAYWSSSSSGGV